MENTDLRKERKEVSDDPRDRHHLVLLTCGVIGVAMLLPMNFYFNADSYWKYKWRRIENVTQPFDLDKFWGSNMSLVSMGANFLCHLINILVGHRFSTRPRILASLGLNIILFAVSTIFTRINTDSWQLGFYSLTLAFALLFNINDSVFQGAFTTIIARFPSRFMGAMMQGQGLGGILSSGLSVILIMLGSGDTVGVATYYFVFATVFLLVSLLFYVMVNYNTFYKHFLGDEKGPVILSEAENKSPLGHLKVVKKIWKLMTSIFLVNVLNMSVYPALVRLAEPVGESETWKLYFLPIGVFFAFNFLDFVGRIVVGFVKWPNPTESGSILCLFLAVLRFIFIPLLLLCNLSPDDRKVTQVLIESDAFFLIIHALMSVSSGYSVTIAMINAPLMVEDKDKSVVGSLMVFMLVFGLLSGAALSFLWISLL